MPFQPGKSGNPSGRPGGARGLSRYVASCTDGGREIVDVLLRYMRDASAPARAISAAELLLDRLAGKPLASHEVVSLSATVAVDHLPGNWSTMTPDEKRAALAQRRAAVLARAAGGPDLAGLLAAGDEDDEE